MFKILLIVKISGKSTFRQAYNIGLMLGHFLKLLFKVQQVGGRIFDFDFQRNKTNTHNCLSNLGD